MWRKMIRILLLILLLPILSFSQNCLPTLTVKDTCMYGYARTWVEWNSLDSGCVIQRIHRGTPYNTFTWNWNSSDTNYMFINNYSPGDPFASSEGFWVVFEMSDSTLTDTVFANDFVCIEGCMDPAYDNYNPLANIPDVCLAIPPPQDDCLDTTKTSITLEITPDTYEGETSVYIINQDDSVLFNLERPFFNSVGTGNIYNNTICVPISDTVRFIITDSYGDGICGSCFGGVDGKVLITDECGDTIYSLLPGDNLNFGDADTSNVFAMKDCSWVPVIGCPNPGYLEFNPAADIMDPSLCLTPRVVGCIDSTMFDFNPIANVPLMEDTCSYELHLTDGGGDGWLGAYIVVNQLGISYGPYTNVSSPVEIINLNLKSNHPVTIRAYSQTSSDATLDQVGFKLINPEGHTILSGGTNPWNDKILIFPDKYIAIPNCPTICTPYIYGCMDNIAYNYDSIANTSDSSCYYAPGCTDPQFLQYYTQGFIADYNDGSCLTEAIWGCTDSTAFNYDSLANLDNGGCVPVILGCMQPLAFNYDPNANVDDNSCVPYIYGCIDPTMFNYDPNANTDNGNCIPYSYGCTDSTAFNYDPNANADNGSCIQVVYGCMDPSAWNYDIMANLNDSSSCLYNAGCITGPGIPYWLNDPCYAWVLEVDEYCCENAWDTICQATYDYCDGTWSGPLLSRTQAKQKLIAVTDLLGRPTKIIKNKLLLYIYSDGSVKRKLIKE
tara:strand:+ start:6 stop:2174 length:2169 start_codon:yes stop_codon:yes gene_type:complete